MSILEATDMVAAATVAPTTPPYHRGEQICVTGPDGASYQVRVEAVTPTPAGEFAVVGVVVAPRKLRSHVVSTVVGADGFGPAVLPR